MERVPRPGEVDGQLSGHLRDSALDAGLVNMKRPQRRPNSLKVLQTIEHAKQFGKGLDVRTPSIRRTGRTARTSDSST